MTDLSTEIAQWRNKKPKDAALLITVEFYHSAFGIHRLINGFKDKALTIESGAPRNAGEDVTFRAIALDAPWPSQKDQPTININVNIARVGSEIKSEVKKIVGFGAFEPVQVIWRAYLSSNTSSPAAAYYLYGQVTMNGESVTINASDENPLAKRVSRILTTTDFPGTIDL
jgi:hypothetical protein